MNIDAALGRHIQYRLRQNTPVGHHHQAIRSQLLQLGGHGAVPHFGGLIYRDAPLLRQLLYRRRGKDGVAAHRLIRLGKDRGHLMPIRQDPLQAGHRKIRRSHKYDAHGSHSSSSSRSSSSVSMWWVMSLKIWPSRWSFSWQMARAIKPSASSVKGLPCRS